MEALLFTVDERRYAVPLARVVEVVHAVNVHALPSAPTVIEGAVNVHGEIVPVIALRSRLGHAPRPVLSSESFVLVNTRVRRVILRSDTTPTIVEIPHVDAPASEELDRVVAGVVATADGIVLFQDVDAFIDGADESVLHDALASSRATA